ncbi:MAG: hypothetical protein DRN05_03795 [Thermoplasmata archaeon]|nr:MAG: hypothetical protein DRN05_03795 [Thermoplasmata archaeon]
MSDIPYKNRMDPKTKAIAVIIILLFVGLIVGLIISKASINYASKRFRERFGEIIPRIHIFIQAFVDIYIIATCIICINIFLLLGLLGIYIDSFRKTKSSFLLGLLLFIGILLVQSVLSLPILQTALVGYMGYSLSLFGILPNMFETIALIILLYLSME